MLLRFFFWFAWAVWKWRRWWWWWCGALEKNHTIIHFKKRERVKKNKEKDLVWQLTIQPIRWVTVNKKTTPDQQQEWQIHKPNNIEWQAFRVAQVPVTQTNRMQRIEYLSQSRSSSSNSPNQNLTHTAPAIYMKCTRERFLLKTQRTVGVINSH